MINVGDVVKYLGINYRVTFVDDCIVKLRRVNGGVLDLEVLRGSNRFNAIFSNKKRDLSFNLTNSVKEDKREIKSNDVVSSKDSLSLCEDTDLFRFILKYSKKRSAFDSDEEAREELKRDILSNETFYFIALSYFRKNSVFKFNCIDRIVGAFESYSDLRVSAPSLCDQSMNKLCEFYRASLNDDSDLSESEVRGLVSRVPRGKDAYNILSCFCGWGKIVEKYGNWVFTSKQLGRVLADVDNIKSAEDF